MNSTKAESRVVAVSAERMTSRVSRPFAAAFGRCGDTEEDRAENEEDQCQRRDQDDDDLLGKPGHRIDVEHLVDECGDVDESHADGRPENVGIFALRRREIDMGSIGDAGCDREGDEKRCHARAQRACFERQRRHRIPPDEGHEQDVAHVQAGEHQTRDQGAGIHVTDGTAELVGKNDQDEGRRDDLGKRAGCCDDAGCDAPVIAIAQHDRQRDQAHGYNRGCDHAGGCCKQRTDEDHRIGEAAANRSEQLADRVEQILSHAGPFKHDAHEGKEWDGEQGVVRHHPPEPFRQRVEQRPGEVDRIGERRKFHPDDEEQQAVCCKREGDRIAKKKEHDQRNEHDRGQVFGDEFNHGRTSGSVACSRGAWVGT
jgi:hypothetical protein